MLRFNDAPSTGTFNTITAGNAVFGNPIFMGNNFKKVSALSAKLDLTAATATITLTAKWQGSNDKSTWIDIAHGSNNPAGVAITTGTSAIVSKAVPLPANSESFAYVRIAVVVGVVTGAAGDLYAIGYNYRQLTGAEAALG